MQRARKVVLLSWMFLLLLVGSLAWTGYQVVMVTYHKVTTYMQPRKGMEIYTALLGNPINGCIEVQNSKDQYVPGIDCCIWLQVNTCPEEVKRIIGQCPYEVSVQAATSLMKLDTSQTPHWWKPQELGDSVFIYEYSSTTEDRIQTLYLSTDSLQAYYLDTIY